MGPSPAEPTEVLVVFGSLMVVAFLLAVGFWTMEWWKSHPGAVSESLRTVRAKGAALLRRFTGKHPGNRKTDSQLDARHLRLPG